MSGNPIKAQNNSSVAQVKGNSGLIKPVNIELATKGSAGGERLQWIREPGSDVARLKVKPNAHIDIRIDGMPIKGGEEVQGKKLRLQRTGNDLVVETEAGEDLVVLEEFYTTDGVMLNGSDWVYTGQDALQFSSTTQGVTEGVVVDKAALALPTAAADAGLSPWMALAAIPLAALGAGGGGGGAAAASAAPSKFYTVTMALGPINDGGAGTTVTLYKADGTKLGVAVFNPATNRWEYTDPTNYSGKVFAVAVDADVSADYRDEATNANADMPNLLTSGTVVAVGEVRVDLVISPLSTLAAQKATGAADPSLLLGKITAGTTNTDILSANIATAKLFGIGAVDLARQAVTFAVDGSGATKAPNTYGAALATVSTLEKNNPGLTTDAFLTQLAAATTLDTTEDVLNFNASGIGLKLIEAAQSPQVGGTPIPTNDTLRVALESTVLDNYAGIDLTAVTPATIGALTPAALASLTASQLADLTPSQVGQVTAVQIDSLTPAQIAALGTDIASLSSAALASLDAAQVAALTSAQLNALVTVNPVAGVDGKGVNTWNAGVINDANPALSGTFTGNLPPGAALAIYDGATFLGNAVISGNTWTLASPTLGDGAHALTARVAVSGGATGTASVPTAITVDTIAPTTGALALVTDSAGASTSDGITNVGTINVTGLEPGATWQYSTDGGTTWTSGNGTSFTLTSAGSGTTYAANAIKVRQTDVAGNVQTASMATNAAAITVDTTVPAPVLSLRSGESSIITSTSTVAHLELTDPGLREGDVVVVRNSDGVLVSSYTVTGADVLAGKVVFDATAATLGQGTRNLSVTVTDAAGNGSGTSAVLAINVDTTGPTLSTTTAPLVTMLNGGDSTGDTVSIAFTFSEPVVGLTSGTIAGVFKVAGADVQATWSGTDGSNVRILTYTALSSHVGNLTINETALTNAFIASIKDANNLAYSGTVPNIDTTPLPYVNGITALATITTVTDDAGVLNPVTAVASGASTDDRRLALAGNITEADGTTPVNTLPANHVVAVYAGATRLGEATPNGSGGWTYTMTSDLPWGVNQLRVQVENPTAGVTGTASALRPVNVTSIAITSISDDVGTAVANLANNATTDDPTPTISGTLSAPLAAGERVAIYDGNTWLAYATVGQTGTTWSCTLPSQTTTTKTLTLNARVVVGDGVAAPTSVLMGTHAAAAGTVINIDIPQPISTTVTLTSVVDNVGLYQFPAGTPLVANRSSDDGTLTLNFTLSGTGLTAAQVAAGQVVAIYDGTTRLGAVTMAANATTGTYTIPAGTTSGLTPGLHTLRLQVENPNVAPSAVNTGAATTAAGASVSFNTNIANIAITSVSDNFGAQQGTVDAGGTTDDNTPSISGTLTAPLVGTETIRVFNGTTEIAGVVTVNGTTWSFAPTNMINGTYNLIARVMPDATTTTDTAAILASISSGTVARALTVSAPVAITATTQIVTATDDLGGKAVRFADTTTNAVLNLTNKTRVGGSMSMSIDVNLNGAATTDLGALFDIGNGGNVNSVGIGFGGTAGQLAFIRWDNTTQAQRLSTGVSMTGWNTVTMTISDTGYSKMYVNGTLVGEYQGGVVADVDRSVNRIGQGMWGGCLPVGAQVRNAALWDSELSAAQVQANRIGVDTTDSTLKLYVPLSDGQLTNIATNKAVGASEPTLGTAASFTDVANASFAGEVASASVSRSTDDNELALSGTITGTLDGSHVIAVYDNGAKLGNAIVSGTTWRYLATNLSTGVHAFKVRVEDTNTGLSSAWSTNTLTTNVTSIAITDVIDNYGAAVGSIAAGGATDDVSPTVLGTLTASLLPNETVRIFNGTTELGIANVSGTSFSYTLLDRTALPETLNLTAKIVGADGTTKLISSAADGAGRAFSISAPALPLPVPTITFANDNFVTNKAVTLAGGTNASVTLTDKTNVGGDMTMSIEVNLNGATPSDWAPLIDMGTGGNANHLGLSFYGGGGKIQGFSWTNTAAAVRPSTAVVPLTGWHQVTMTVSSTGYNKLYVDGVLVGEGQGIVVPTLDRTINRVGNGVWGNTLPAGVQVRNVAIWDSELSAAQVQQSVAGIDATNSTLEVYIPLTDGALTNIAPAKLTTVAATLGSAASFSDVVQNVSFTGDMATGGVSDDTLPLLKGTLNLALQSGEVVEVYKDGQFLGEAVVNGQNWRFGLSTALTAGTHNFTAKVKNTATGLYAATGSNTFAYTVAAITLGTVIDNVGTSQGNVAQGSATDDTTPTLSGSLTAPLQSGQKVVLYNGDTAMTGATVQTSGTTWTATFDSSPLTVGTTYNFNARVTDTAGSTVWVGSHTSGTGYPVTIVATPATVTATAAITSATDNVGLLQSNMASGQTTDDTTLALAGTYTVGTLAAGQVLAVYNNGVRLGTATTDGAGNWTFLTPALAVGARSLQVQVENPVAGASSLNTTGSPTTALGTPSAAYNAYGNSIALVSVSDNAGTTVGTLAANAVTDDNTPTLSGNLGATLQAGEVVGVYNGNTRIGTAQVSGMQWTFTPAAGSELAPGSYLFNARIEGSSGVALLGTHELGAGYAVSVAAATSIATTTTITNLTNDGTGLKVTPVATAQSTDDNSLTVNGTISQTLDTAAGQVVGVYVNGLRVGNAAVTGTTWTYSLAAISGVNDVKAQVENANFGAVSLNNGAATTAMGASSNLYQTNLTRVLTLAVTDDTAPVTGNVAAGGTTDDVRPTFTITLSAPLLTGESVRLFNADAAMTGTATKVNETTWSFTPTADMAYGSYTALNVRVMGSDGSTVLMGSHAAGLGQALNIAQASLINTTVTIGSVTDNISINGSVGSTASPQTINTANSTDDTTPTVVGTLSAALKTGEVVAVYDGNTRLGVATVDGTSWTFTPSTALAAGSHVFSAQVENPGAGTTTAPNTTASTAAGVNTTTDVTVNIAALAINTAVTSTTDTTPDLSGTISAQLLPGDVIKIYDGETALAGTATPSTVGGVTTWSMTAPTLTTGTHNLTARVYNAAGQLVLASNVLTLAVAPTTPPSATAIISNFTDNFSGNGTVGSALSGVNIGSASSTDDTTLVLNGILNGTLAAGEVVRVYNGTTLLGNATVNGSTWTYTPSIGGTTVLAVGAYNFKAQVENLATGLFSTPSTLAVGVSSITLAALTDDVGTVKGDLALSASVTTDDLKPKLSGVLGVELAAGESIKVYNGTTEIAGTISRSGLNWSFDPSGDLVNGTYTLTAKVVNSTGQVVLATAPATVIVNNVPVAATASISSVLDNYTYYGSDGSDSLPVDITAGTHSTDDTTPVLNGALTAALSAGQVVTVYDGTTAIGTATVSGLGWTFTPTTPLSMGDHSLSVRVENPATGSQSAPSAAVDMHVNSLAITAVEANEGANQGGSVAGTVTMSALATSISSYTQIGLGDLSRITSAEQVSGYLMGSFLGELFSGNSANPVHATGRGLVRVSDTEIRVTLVADSMRAQAVRVSLIQDGPYIAIKPLNGLFNTPSLDSAASATFNYATGGTSYPDNSGTGIALTPTASGLGINALTIVNAGAVPFGDSTPVIKGSLGAALEAGEVLRVYANGNLLGNAAIDTATNTWSYTVTTPLQTGAYKFEAQVRSADGAVKLSTAPQWYTMADLSAPNQSVSIVRVSDDSGSRAMDLTNDGLPTDDRLPTVTGTISAPLKEGQAVQVFSNGTWMGNALVSGTSWTFIPKEPLGVGNYSLQAKVVNLGTGVFSPNVSDIFGMKINWITPGSIKFYDDTGASQGVVAQITNDQDIKITGKIGGALGDGLEVAVYGNLITSSGNIWSKIGVASFTSATDWSLDHVDPSLYANPNASTSGFRFVIQQTGETNVSSALAAQDFIFYGQYTANEVATPSTTKGIILASESRATLDINHLSGVQTVDLTMVDSSVQPVAKQINLAEGSTVKLDINDVLLSSTNIFNTLNGFAGLDGAGKKQLLITNDSSRADGNASGFTPAPGTVNVVGSGWTYAGDVTYSDTDPFTPDQVYRIYNNGNAQLLIDSDHLRMGAVL